MSARDDILTGLRQADDGTVGDLSPEQILDAYRAEVLAEVSTWLVKKAREYRAAGRTVEADTASRLSSKVDRGAVRPDNLRMLPADFFEPGRTYTHVDDGTDWKFRVATVTTHPEDRERTAPRRRPSPGPWRPPPH